MKIILRINQHPKHRIYRRYGAHQTIEIFPEVIWKLGELTTLTLNIIHGE